MDRTIRASSSLIDNRIDSLWDIYREKKVQLHLVNDLITAILAVPELQRNILAMFRPEDRIIAMTEDVLLRSREDEMDNIFLHELAHALDWHMNGASGHGPSFRECCRMLRIDPEFSKSHVRLSMERDNARREKIRKLMSLSSSPFENEAAEAIRKAQKLMLEGSTETEERVIYTSELYEAKRLPFWTRELAWYASSSSGVYSIIVPRDDSRVITIHGSVEEIELAIYIFDYIISASDQEIRRMRREGRAVSRGSFICGAVDTLSEKTRGQTEEGALIAIGRENEELAKALIYSKSKVRTSYSRTSINRNSYDLGHDFGNRIDISRSHRIKLIGTK